MTKPTRRTFKRNEKGRDFVLGDLHGCFEHFEALLEDVKFDKTIDRMFSVGDLIDRGPKSLECLKLIEKPWFFSIQGNHEDIMIEEIVHGHDMMWIPNGGQWAQEIFENGDTRELLHLVKATMKLPLMIIVETEVCGRVGISHAESPSSWDKNKIIDLNQVLWRREKCRWASHMGKIPAEIDMTVHGHTPVGMTPHYHEKMNAWWIDTGCFATGVLTALQIDGPELKEPKIHKVWIAADAPGWR